MTTIIKRSVLSRQSISVFSLRLLVICSISLLLASCAVKPTPYTLSEIKERAALDRQAMYADQEPVTGPITFYEASARALKYNLDYKLKLMEQALARSLNDVAAYEMLPRVVAGAGYVNRSNDSGGSSVGIEDG